MPDTRFNPFRITVPTLTFLREWQRIIVPATLEKSLPSPSLSIRIEIFFPSGNAASRTANYFSNGISSAANLIVMGISRMPWTRRTTSSALAGLSQPRPARRQARSQWPSAAESVSSATSQEWRRGGTSLRITRGDAICEEENAFACRAAYSAALRRGSARITPPPGRTPPPSNRGTIPITPRRSDRHHRPPRRPPGRSLRPPLDRVAMPPTTRIAAASIRSAG